MSTSETIEKLAAAIAEEVYIDIAKWHLYVNDAHLHIPLAEKLYPMVADGKIDSAAVNAVLSNMMVTIGGGKREIPLIDFIPKQAQSRLVQVLEDFSRN